MSGFEWAVILIGLSLLSAFYIWEGREYPDILDEEKDMTPWHIEQREAGGCGVWDWKYTEGMEDKDA